MLPGTLYLLSVALKSVNEMLQANLGQGKNILAQATFGDNVLLADIPEEATKEDIKLEISQIINKFSVDYVTEDHYAIVKLNNSRCELHSFHLFHTTYQSRVPCEFFYARFYCITTGGHKMTAAKFM